MTLNELIRKYPQIKLDPDDKLKFGFWPATISKGYVRVAYLGKREALHILIVNPPEGYEVDHKDRNTLNYSRINLRVATRAQNLANRSTYSNSKTGHKGVTKIESSGKYRARFQQKVSGISVNQHLGCYDTLEEAINAYNSHASKYHGEFAATSFKL